MAVASSGFKLVISGWEGKCLLVAPIGKPGSQAHQALVLKTLTWYPKLVENTWHYIDIISKRTNAYLCLNYLVSRSICSRFKGLIVTLVLSSYFDLVSFDYYWSCSYNNRIKTSTVWSSLILVVVIRRKLWRERLLFCFTSESFKGGVRFLFLISQNGIICFSLSQTVTF